MADEQKTPQDKIYTVTVLVLMVVILATLAALWMIERRGHRQAAADLVALQQRNQLLEKAIQQLVIQQGLGIEIKVNRDDLPMQTVNLDGQTRKVYVLSARTGARLGFEPGDVVTIASQPASSQAATEP
jgi:type II secretory pathway pseudopilin PulG